MNDLEIYKERYATFRHLDKLRWQMFQIAIGSASAVFALSVNSYWSIIALGIIFFMSGMAMLRIGHGINKNSYVLKEVAEKIGDTNMPIVKNDKTSISFKIAMFISLFGSILIIVGILLSCLK